MQKLSPHGKGRGWLILAGLATIIGLIAIASIVVTAVNAAGPSGTPTATTTSPVQGPGKGPGKGHGPKAALTVTGVSGQKITAKRRDGGTVTITTTSSTTYTRAGQSINASAITTGTNIHVRGTTNSDGSITATRVDIVLPGYHGVVTSVSDSSISVQDPKGNSTHTIKISSITSFIRAGQTVSLSAITKGETIGAAGSLNSDGSLNAQVVHIDLPHAGGQITKISGSTLTTQDHRGTHTVQINSSTSFINDQTQQKIALSDLKVGDNIHVEGTLNSDGSLAAQIVHLGPKPPTGTPSASATPPTGTPSQGTSSGS